MNVFLLTGFPGSGKSTALETANDMGLFTVEMSDVVRSEYSGDEENDNNLGKWASSRKQEHGNGYFAECSAKFIRENIGSDRDVAISGIRSVEEVDTFEGFFDNVIVVGIRCPKEIRWKRVFERDGVRPSEMSQRDQRERQWGLQKVLNRHTNHILYNETCTQELFKNKVKTVIHLEDL
jgi:dephospho-CoA kinase